MQIRISRLRDLVVKSLRDQYSEADAQAISDVVLFGETSGRTSHGLVRLLVGGSSVLSQHPSSPPRISAITSVSAVIHGAGNPGMLVGSLACREVIARGQAHGFALVGTRGTFSTSGCLTYYLERISSAGLVGIIMSQSPRSTPPHGGIEPMYGTNPISFGIPSSADPLIFDMGTSAITFGQLLQAGTLGQTLPVGVAIDKSGNPTTDPAQAMDGATLPFDGSYKGAGLAMMVEVLAGALPGAGFAGHNDGDGWGNLFLAFSPSLLGDPDSFRRRVTLLVESVRTSRTRDGSLVRIPGEKTLAAHRRAVHSGVVDIDDSLYELLLKNI